MKKFYAVLLSLTLALSMTAFGGSQANAAEAASEEDIFAVMILPNVSEVFYSAWASDAQAAFDEAGIRFEYAACDNDVNVMNQQIENYITMGCTHMFCEQVSPEAQAVTLKNAVDAGIEVSITTPVDDPDSYTYLWSLDQYELGDKIAKMAAEWIDSTFPDAEDNSVEVALFGTRAIEQVLPRTEAEANVDEYSSKAVIVENYDYGASTQPNRESQDWMDNLLVKHPNVKCIIGQGGTTIDMNEIVMNDDSIDKATFAFFDDQDTAVMFESIAKSENNESAIRGTCTVVDTIGGFFFKLVTDKDNVNFIDEKTPTLGLKTYDVSNVAERLG